MKFKSTRDVAGANTYSASQVIKQGLANDGGLFVPESIPTMSFEDIRAMRHLSYPERAAIILSKFLGDYTYEELLEDCRASYSEAAFEGGAAPVVKFDEGLYSLELWHGPTCAFKDMALQIMPRLLSRALIKTNEEKTALILVATSGDTGKAALEGYKDIDRVKIMVFYPQNGVSKVQKLQMATQTGENVCVCAIDGNFDDAQSGVKTIFSDREAADALAAKKYMLSSANSINWGRLAPQIVYYFSAYCDMLANGEIKEHEEINVCVPTGNFGNIFAAYLAKRMGLPIHKLICASNSNNVLTEFLETGVYDRNRQFHLTVSPSMDILISSNLERLLYCMAGPDATAQYMAGLSRSGKYKIDAETKSAIDEHFVGFYANEQQTLATIQSIFENNEYLLDTHTAVAVHCAKQYINKTDDRRKMVIASTASPYKFASDVFMALTSPIPLRDELMALNKLSELSGTPIPAPLKDIDKREVRFTKTVSPDRMLDEVLNFAE